MGPSAAHRSVATMFDRIAPRYDLLNRVLSLWVDRWWRRCLARTLVLRPGSAVLDLGAGTGDVLLSVLQAWGEHASVIAGLDPARNMLALAKEKLARAGAVDRVSLIAGDARTIPFGDERFDAVTMAFGIRNVAEPEEALREALRVLRAGGRLAILEFSLPRNRIIRMAYLFYLRRVIPWLGGLLSGNPEAYRYLNRSIEAFPHGEAFARVLGNQGFQNVTARPLTFGIVTLYGAVKPASDRTRG